MNEFSNELILNLNKERKEFIENVFAYSLPQGLDDVSAPLTLKEVNELSKKYDLQNIDANADMISFTCELLSRRGVSAKEAEKFSYPDMIIFTHKVLLSTFDARAIAAKK